jgi:hypothetical protein
MPAFWRAGPTPARPLQACRRHTTTEVFGASVAACRDAIDRFEIDQVVL